MVAVARAVGRKRALEMLMTGDPIDAATAERWGMINRVVLPEALEAESWDLIRRATRGSRRSKATGKAAFYAHVDLSDAAAYREATEVMAAASQTPEAQERMRAFLEKRGAVYADGPKDPV
jgi:enoyl-CoA hydratase/carnithine racemase